MRGRRKTAAGVFCVPVRLEYFFNSWGFFALFFRAERLLHFCDAVKDIPCFHGFFYAQRRKRKQLLTRCSTFIQKENIQPARAGADCGRHYERKYKRRC